MKAVKATTDHLRDGSLPSGNSSNNSDRTNVMAGKAMPEPCSFQLQNFFGSPMAMHSFTDSSQTVKSQNFPVERVSLSASQAAYCVAGRAGLEGAYAA
jgi:hypothetical protein